LIRKLLFALQLCATFAVLSRLAKETVTVVIPARNEVERIGDCLGGLSFDELHEVLVVDDESTDATADIAKDLGARVVSGDPLPPSWVGKPWALQQGLREATGDWVIFLDADTIPQPGLIGAAIDAAKASNAHVLTLAPQFVCDSAVQQGLHASMLTTLVYRFLPAGTTTIAKPSRTIGNGQCMVMNRRWLQSQGGFEAAATNMTDDIAFVRAMAARGANVAFFDGSDVLRVRMHRSIGEVWREWGRSLPMVDVTPPAQRYGDLATVWLTMALPLARVLAQRSTKLERILVGLRLVICLALGRSYSDKHYAIWLSPLFDIATAVRLTQATVWPVRSWRGRTYQRTKTVSR
jgi:dolichol-phosphate mannosyltransferase